MPEGTPLPAESMYAPQTASLRRIVSELQALAGPTERAFTDIGAALGGSMDALGRLEAGFANLSKHLDADHAAVALSAMSGALRDGSDLAAWAAESAELLKDIDTTAGRAVGPLATLSQIAGEIGALTTNAKVLVAQIGSDAIDFSVFTIEVGRLHGQAEDVIGRVTRRLYELGATTAAARHAEDVVVRTKQHEIDELRTRLERGVDSLARQRSLTRQAVADVEEISRNIAGRVAQCIGELQINDLTSQRIEHVWRALAAVCDVTEATGGQASEYAWASALGNEQKAALLASVCRLQARQLERAVQDFTHEITALKDNLHGLSETATGVMERAATVIGVSDGAEGSFVGDLQQHADRASLLLRSYSEAQSEVHRLVEQVAVGFAELAGDIGVIRLIDEDMRLIGLNATLKCGRLGPAGRALGVVAQELRGCSRRTEEAARPVSDAVDQAAAGAAHLAALVEQGQTKATELSATLDASMRALAALGATLEAAYSPLRNDCEGISRLLAEACDGLVVDQRLASISEAAVAELSEIAEAVAADAAPAETVRENVLRLLGSHYTMASERQVHDLFDGGLNDIGGPAPEPSAFAAIDEFFF